MKYTVQVPATSANCGPGFDCLGLALTLYNTFSFEPYLEDSQAMQVAFEGLGADMLLKERIESNLAIAAMKKVYDVVHATMPNGRLHSVINVPPSRGLGSSSTAIVGGLLLANYMLGNPLTKEALLLLGTEIEGHPDNICPAIFGSLCCAIKEEDQVLHTIISVPEDLRFVVVSPNVSCSTEKARALLPERVSFSHAVENVGATALFITAIAQGKWEYIGRALKDQLHVPYRMELIPNGKRVLEAGVLAGALGTTISGAGSTVIAYCNGHEEEIAQAMVDAFREVHMEATATILKADTKGACII